MLFDYGQIIAQEEITLELEDLLGFYKHILKKKITFHVFPLERRIVGILHNKTKPQQRIVQF